MVTHSSVLAWRIPGTGEPDGLPSMGSHGVAQSRTRLKRLSSSSSSSSREHVLTTEQYSWELKIHYSIVLSLNKFIVEQPLQMIVEN